MLSRAESRRGSAVFRRRRPIVAASEKEGQMKRWATICYRYRRVLGVETCLLFSHVYWSRCPDTLRVFTWNLKVGSFNWIQVSILTYMEECKFVSSTVNIHFRIFSNTWCLAPSHDWRPTRETGVDTRYIGRLTRTAHADVTWMYCRRR